MTEAEIQMKLELIKAATTIASQLAKDSVSRSDNHVNKYMEIWCQVFQQLKKAVEQQ